MVRFHGSEKEKKDPLKRREKIEFEKRDLVNVDYKIFIK